MLLGRLAATLAVCVSLALGVAENGVLETSDPQLPSGEYLDIFERRFEAGTSVTVSIESSEFDPYLVVLGPAQEEILQIDDSEGFGLNVHATFEVPESGPYTIVVTSALAEEVGAYSVEISSAAPAPAGNPLAAGEQFAGVYEGNGVRLELASGPTGYRGELTFQGRTYAVTARASEGGLEGSFSSGESSFAFTAELRNGALILESGGAVYSLDPLPQAEDTRTENDNPLAGGAPGTERAADTADTVTTAGVPTLTPPTHLPTPVAPELENPGPGFATGYVLRRDGQPLAGAEIRIEGVNMQGGRISAYPVTDARGFYATRVPDGLVRVNAYLTLDYEGSRYFIRLAPETGSFDQEFDTSLTGIVRNFTFRFDGLRPGGDPQEQADYFGGYGAIEVGLPYCCVEAHTVETGSGVRIELTPDGPLLDGTEGSTIVLGCDACVPEPVSYAPTFNRPVMEFREIPPGRYRARATLITPDGTASPAKIGSHHYRDGASSGAVTQEPAEELIIVFPPYNLYSGEPGVGAVNLYVNE